MAACSSQKAHFVAYDPALQHVDLFFCTGLILPSEQGISFHGKPYHIFHFIISNNNMYK